MEKHDPEIQEIEVDAQSTVWVMKCKKCGRKTRPLYCKDDARLAGEELSCKGATPQ